MKSPLWNRVSLAGLLLLPGIGRLPAGPLHGLTLDSVANLAATNQALSRLSTRATARVVFDEGVQPDYYAKPLAKIASNAYVMGEILDSFYVNTVSVDAYVARANAYYTALKDNVDIWEVGNEVNGEWLGATDDVVAKFSGAYDRIHAQGGTTALTLYYNQDCWQKPENEMFTWADANVPERLKNQLDFVWISYYEDDCNGLQPDWPSVFDRLGKMFPNSRIGFGETGTKKAAKKQEYLTRYYSLQIDQPHYVGGYFWWYGRQDLVPYTKPLWSVFNCLISGR